MGVGWLLISRHRQEDWLVEVDSHKTLTISSRPAKQPYFWEKEKLFLSQTYHRSVSDRKASPGLIYQGQLVWPRRTACCSVPLLPAGGNNSCLAGLAVGMSERRRGNARRTRRIRWRLGNNKVWWQSVNVDQNLELMLFLLKSTGASIMTFVILWKAKGETLLSLISQRRTLVVNSQSFPAVT